MKIAGKIGVVVVLAAILPLVAVGYYAKEKSSEALEANALAAMDFKVQEVAAAIHAFLGTAKQDAAFLIGVPPVQGIIRARDNNGFDPIGKSSTEVWEKRLTVIFESFGIEKPYYSQLRYLDETGMEMVRVDFEQGQAKVAATDQMQNKAQASYFSETMKTPKGQLHMSVLNLNREKGVIEVPHKPVLRIGLPVFDPAGQRRGAIVLNILGKYILDLIPESSASSQGKFYMLNKDGYYLSHPEQSKTWGFEDNREDNYFTETTGVESIKSNSATHGKLKEVANGDIDIAYANIQPNKNDSNNRWTIINSVPRAVLLKAVGDFQRTLYFLMAIVLGITVIVSMWLSRSWFVTPLNEVLNVLNRFSQGDMAARIQRTGTDEIGQVGEAFNNMALQQQESQQREQELKQKQDQQMQELSNAANIQERVEVLRKHIEQVANGDLRELIKVEGEDDLAELGKHLNAMTMSLSSVAGDIGDVAEDISTTLVDVSKATATQATAVSEQASSTNQMTTTLEEIRQTSAQTLEKALALGQAAERTRQESSQGSLAVEEAVKGMDEIRGQVDDIAQTIMALSEQTQQIGEITEVVNSLAQQSKMLALNASIEAAKAGDAGKGFAVVADEVKDLAEQSQQSTAQVQKILQDIRHATDRAVMATEEGSKGVDKGVSQVERSGEVMLVLSDVIQDSVKSSQQIVAAVRQEAAGIEQVNAAMNEINNGTQQFLLSAKNTEKANKGLSLLVEKLRESISVYKV